MGMKQLISRALVRLSRDATESAGEGGAGDCTSSGEGGAGGGVGGGGRNRGGGPWVREISEGMAKQEGVESYDATTDVVENDAAIVEVLVEAALEEWKVQQLLA